MEHKYSLSLQDLKWRDLKAFEHDRSTGRFFCFATQGKGFVVTVLGPPHVDLIMEVIDDQGVVVKKNTLTYADETKLRRDDGDFVHVPRVLSTDKNGKCGFVCSLKAVGDCKNSIVHLFKVSWGKEYDHESALVSVPFRFMARKTELKDDFPSPPGTQELSSDPQVAKSTTSFSTFMQFYRVDSQSLLENGSTVDVTQYIIHQEKRNYIRTFYKAWNKIDEADVPRVDYGGKARSLAHKHSSKNNSSIASNQSTPAPSYCINNSNNSTMHSCFSQESVSPTPGVQAPLTIETPAANNLHWLATDSDVMEAFVATINSFGIVAHSKGLLNETICAKMAEIVPHLFQAVLQSKTVAQYTHGDLLQGVPSTVVRPYNNSTDTEVSGSLSLVPPAHISASYEESAPNTYSLYGRHRSIGRKDSLDGIDMLSRLAFSDTIHSPATAETLQAERGSSSTGVRKQCMSNETSFDDREDAPKRSKTPLDAKTQSVTPVTLAFSPPLQQAGCVDNAAEMEVSCSSSIDSAHSVTTISVPKATRRAASNETSSSGASCVEGWEYSLLTRSFDSPFSEKSAFSKPSSRVNSRRNSKVNKPEESSNSSNSAQPAVVNSAKAGRPPAAGCISSASVLSTARALAFDQDIAIDATWCVISAQPMEVDLIVQKFNDENSWIDPRDEKAYFRSPAATLPMDVECDHTPVEDIIQVVSRTLSESAIRAQITAESISALPTQYSGCNRGGDSSGGGDDRLMVAANEGAEVMACSSIWASRSNSNQNTGRSLLSRVLGFGSEGESISGFADQYSEPDSSVSNVRGEDGTEFNWK